MHYCSYGQRSRRPEYNPRVRQIGSILDMQDFPREAGVLHWLRMAGGVGLLILGVLGLILPVLPGWIFLIPGLMVLSKEYHWARNILDWLKRRKPQRFSEKWPQKSEKKSSEA